MEFEPGKKSGKIPAFGDWDKANELPITQYFESARQAGLLRHHHHQQHHHRHQYSDNSHISNGSSARAGGGVAYGYAYTSSADFQKPPLRVAHVPPPHRKPKQGVGGVNNGGEECNRRRRCGCPQHQHRQRIKQAYDEEEEWVGDVKHQQQHRTRRSSSGPQLFNGDLKKQFPKHSAIADVHKAPPTATQNNVKPVDEDLYKIPPELLLHHSKKKKMLRFFSKCLVPPCRA